jgi:1-acyl-sn-glycerol-3-phosphate acyltransferase
MKRALRVLAGALQFVILPLAAWPLMFWLRLSGREDRLICQARWMQLMSRWVSRILHLEPVVSGSLPGPGLLVANHLGYADVLALGSVLSHPAFVAKREVRSWPVVGWLVAMAGTVFVDRENPRRLAQSLAEIDRLVAAGLTVVVFPEGTTTDGSQVLPFRSSLLAVAAELACPVTPVAIRYIGADGRPNRSLAYIGEDVFAPHLAAALAAEPTRVHLAFGDALVDRERKELARRLRGAVLAALGSPDDP